MNQIHPNNQIKKTIINLINNSNRIHNNRFNSNSQTRVQIINKTREDCH